MDSKFRFFSYDGDNPTFHETEAMAREDAEQALANYAEAADEDPDHEVNDDAAWVCWGRLVQATREKLSPEDGTMQYNLKDVT